VALAQGIPGSSAAMLGALIAAEGLAGLVSSPFWGRWADDNSQRVFAAGSAMAASISLAVVFWSWTLAESEFTSAFYVFAFFVLGVSHAGVRLGRKTWLVDMADGNKRTDYVAVSNSAIGVILLLSGLLGALAALVSVQLTIVLLAVGGFAGAFLSARPHRA
ncbi:MAG: MFS transporter, partial [Gammaproteobacteria bacterium]|nr:MFS transporter [Gammaproteobacteria bacterium]